MTGSHAAAPEGVGRAAGEPAARDDPGAAMDGVWSSRRRWLTIGLVLTVTLVAFESLAIATVMPTVKDDLGGLALYGWVFSGFFLASLVGIVVAGQLADRRGLATAFVLGLVLFAAGLVVGGAARSMPVLVAARVAQGFGSGTIPPTAYAAIGRGYPAEQRPHMFAVISTAWVLPALIGPAVASVVEHALSWRWVFLGLVPFVAVAAVTTIGPLAALSRAGRRTDADPSAGASREADVSAPPGDELATEATSGWAQLARVVVLVVGIGAVFIAIDGQPLGVALALLIGGAPAATWALLRLLPAGTLRLLPGVPATVGVRGVLACGFFAADAYVPLAVVDGRGGATWIGGAALSAASLTWAGGAWAAARAIDRMGPRRLNQLGFSAVAAGVAVLAAVARGAPLALAVPGWAIAGLGMGLAYAPLAVTVLAAARPGEEGEASSALQLSDALGIALGAAVGGWVIATADHRGASVASATTVVFVIALAISLAGIAAASRLPLEVPTAPD
ncbi:MAG: MFS transporter [Acidimicrobiales bacterium]